MIAIGSIILRITDLAREQAFWAAALDYLSQSGASDDFALLSPRSGAGPDLALDRVRATDAQPRRFHLDLYADDQRAEVDRLVALGASRVDWAERPQDADHVILADPERNRFCVVDSAWAPSRAKRTNGAGQPSVGTTAVSSSGSSGSSSKSPSGGVTVSVPAAMSTVGTMAFTNGTSTSPASVVT